MSPANGSTGGLGSGAGAGLPPVSPREQATKAAFERYGVGLAVWLSSQNVVADDSDDPMVGTWTVHRGRGLFVFADSEFTWYKDADVLDDNYYKGTYYFLPGAQTHVDYVLNQGEGREAYSVFLHYTATRQGGADKPTNYRGLFTVARQGTPDVLYIKNQRTAGRMIVTRQAP
jgi:hypothetical protein